MRRRNTPPGSRPSRVTLRDIASATGYTVNTVSRALRDLEDISAGTRRLIQDQARRAGYIPDALAASLRSGRSRTVSVIIPDISDPLFAILVRDMELRLKARDFDLFVQNTNEDEDLERRAILAAVGKKIDGIILCPCQKGLANTRLIQANGVPLVLVGRRFPRASLSYVVADDAHGGFVATDHLVGRGHTRIAFLNGPSHISSARERLAGYRAALQHHGIPYRAELVREVGIAMGECAGALEALLRAQKAFTAIFCFSDLMAWEAISLLQSRGMAIPGDVAVVGFDDIQSRLSYPYPLTSVGYGKGRMAEAAVDSLLAEVEGPQAAARLRLVVDVELAVRSST